MLVSDNINELWLAIRETLSTEEPVETRNGLAYEEIGFAACLTDIDKNFLTVPERNLSAVYANAELLWYLSGSGSTEMIRGYAPQYAKFTEPNGEAFGAYGARWIRDPAFKAEALRANIAPNQLLAAIDVLKKHPNSRQCIVNMWNGGDLVHAQFLNKKDLPCTISMHFQIRDDVLHCCVYMRSSDMWLGFPYDVFCFTSIQRMIAWELGISPGQYYHFAGNMHMYTKNDKGDVFTSVENKGHKYKDAKYEFKHNKHSSVVCEQMMRLSNGESFPQHIIDRISNPILRDAVLCCSTKWLEHMEVVASMFASEEYKNL